VTNKEKMGLPQAEMPRFVIRAISLEFSRRIDITYMVMSNAVNSGASKILSKSMLHKNIHM